MSNEAPLNLVVVRGVLSRDPEVRVLPSGSVVVAYEVTVARATGPDDSVPVVWSDPPDRRASVHAGDTVAVLGRVRRRFFRAGGTTQSRTEVVAERVVAGRSSRRALAGAERVLAEASATVDGPTR
jgi:single-strand DNA-binding protein